MALQSSGAITFTNLVNEFGAPYPNVQYNVPWLKWEPQTPWVKASLGGGSAANLEVWTQFMIDYAVYPSNTETLTGVWHPAVWKFGNGSGEVDVNFNVTKSSSCYNEANHIGIDGSNFNTNDLGNFTRTVNYGWSYEVIPDTTCGETDELIDSTNGLVDNRLRLDDYHPKDHGDYNDLMVEANKGKYYRSNGKIYFTVPDPNAGSPYNVGTLPVDQYTLTTQADNLMEVYWNDTYLGFTGNNESPDGGMIGPPTTFDINITTETEYYITCKVINFDTGGDWALNPGGGAWELKNSKGVVIRRSSDIFNFSIGSTGWGSFLSQYGVYPSRLDPLSDSWHETIYTFVTESAANYSLECAADSQAKFYLNDVFKGTTFNSATSDTISLGQLEGNTAYKLTTQVYNGATQPPSTGNEFDGPINNWDYNPGAVAFAVKYPSTNVGTDGIVKTSLQTGGQNRIGGQTTGGWSLGNYRVSESYGELNDVRLDTDAGVNSDVDIPKKPEPISFSNFYNGRLNVILDYYSGDPEYRVNSDVESNTNARSRYSVTDKTRVVGGFKGRPTNPAGTKVVIIIGKEIGIESLDTATAGKYSGQSTKCAFRTGTNWGAGTSMRIEVTDSGRVYGAGGSGGNGGLGGERLASSMGGSPGDSGTGALGVEHDGALINVRGGGKIIAGYGGGGGGGGDHESTAAERCASGGGGGGGAGLPPGAGNSAGATYCDYTCSGSAGSNGSKPNGGEQGGAGGGGCDQDNKGEAISGAGGRGGDQTLADQSTSSGNVGGWGENLGAPGGAGGAGGGAIRKSSGVSWTYGTEHVASNVYGEGKTDASESPTGVT